MRFRGSDVHVMRVLSETEDFAIVEVAKHGDVKFTLDPDTPDRFYTIVFVRTQDGKAEVFNPFD